MRTKSTRTHHENVDKAVKKLEDISKDENLSVAEKNNAKALPQTGENTSAVNSASFWAWITLQEKSQKRNLH